MPKMDGSEAMKHIRAIPPDQHKNPDTPIIVLTANAVAGVREQFLEEGFDDYVSKPVSAATLEFIIRYYLPDELVIEGAYDAGNEELSQENRFRFEKFTNIEGLDVKNGIKNSGNADIYEDVLEEFVLSAKDRMDFIVNDLMDEDIRDFKSACAEKLSQTCRCNGTFKAGIVSGAVWHR